MCIYGYVFVYIYIYRGRWDLLATSSLRSQGWCIICLCCDMVCAWWQKPRSQNLPRVFGLIFGSKSPVAKICNEFISFGGKSPCISQPNL